MKFLILCVVLLSVGFCKNLKKPLCGLCENVVKEVDDVLKHGGDIEKAVDDFCRNDVPGFLVDYCVKLVSKNLEFIIEKLKEHESAEKICYDIYLCSN